jgi:Lon-like protease
VRRWVGIFTVLLLVVGGIVLSRGDVPCEVLETQPACYVALSPGPTSDTLQIIDVEGADTYPSLGEMLLTTISVQDSLTLTSWARAVASGAVDTVPREQVYPTGIDRDEIRERNRVAMADSQLTATIAALSAAGYELEGEGARIVMIAEDAVTDELQEDDLIVAVEDGEPVTDSTDVVSAVQAKTPGEPFVVHVIRDGEEVSVEVELGSAPDDPDRAYIGILLTTEIDMPVEVVIDAGSIGGPSGGLIFALSIIDALDEQDLTGGEVIAGTGTVGRDGSVGSVGGVRQKVVGATQRRDGEPPATVFLVPRSNLDDALSAPVRSDVTIVPVDDLDAALEALTDLGAGREPAEAMTLSAGR